MSQEKRGHIYDVCVRGNALWYIYILAPFSSPRGPRDDDIYKLNFLLSCGRAIYCCFLLYI